MRIYDLAKEMGQKLDTEIKSAKLAEEFRTMPQFAAIQETIKSHASIVDDEHARIMFDIYKKRLGKSQSGLEAPRTREAGPAPKNVSNPPTTLPKSQPQTTPAPPRPVSTQPAPAPVRPALPPRPAPITPGGMRPATTPIPAVRRPMPPQAEGSRVTPPEPPVAPVTPAAVPAPAAPVAEKAAPTPVAPTVSVRPVAPAASPATPARPAAHPGHRPAGPPQERPHPRPATDERGQPIVRARSGQPGQPGASRGAAPKSQKFRPTGLASELKSSSGTTGVSASPDEKARRAALERTAGEPTAPAAPKFSTDSPFTKPLAPRRPPEPRPRPDRPQGDRPDRPQGDRPGYDRPHYDRPQGDRPQGDRPQGDRYDRPTGDRPQGDRPRYDRPQGDRPPGDRPQGDRPQGDRPRYDRPPGDRPQGDRPQGDRPRYDRPGDRPTGPGGDRRPRGHDAASGPPVLTTVPEIGVMKLKPKRHRPEAGKRPGETDKPGSKGAKPLKGAVAKKIVRPSKVYGDADEFRKPLKATKRPRPQHSTIERRREEPVPKAAGPVILTGPVTVAEFAEKLGMPTAELIKRAFLKGKAITINQLINLELAEEMAFDMDIDLSIQLEGDESDIADYRQVEDQPEDLLPRPPVVTIMGHVDHGKTTLLDFYRRSQVVEGEFGGITQHIGAYHVTTHRGDIVFLDTPGHEAFTSMRARGVQCTDIVVLVVSADDGVMPQTLEAINHAKAASVPVIVAINKIDLPGANPERVRSELLQHGVISTQLGGDTEFVEISAKKGTNMDTLLEIISLQAEVLELKSNPNRAAEAVVIESHVDPLRGAVATILVQKGTLKVGQAFVVGQQSGRVRALADDHGRTLEEAKLSQPCELMGLSGPPEVGEIMVVVDDERKAREIAARREQRRRLLDLGTTRHVTLEGLHDMIAEGKIKELNIILKADVQGSIEAIAQSLEKLATGEVRIRVLHSGTGSVTESDVNLAMASSAVIIGFNIRPEQTAADMAMREGVEIKSYRIIYELLEDIEKAMVGMLDKRFKENIQGRTEIRQVFRVTRFGTVAGCMVLFGEVHRNATCRLIRDGKVVYEGKVASLRRVKDDVAKVAAGFECGAVLDKFQDVKTGDIIETYTLEEIPAELSRT